MAMKSVHALVLRLAGCATAITGAFGAFAVRNASLMHEWRICGFPAGCNYHGGPVSPLATTSAFLPDGSAASIWLYAGIISASSVLVAIAALACAAHPQVGWRFVLCAAAVLLAVTVVLFRLPPPERIAGMMGPCIATGSCPTEVGPYPFAIPSVWYVAPAAMLAVLTAGLGLFPWQSRGASTSLTGRA